MSNYGIDFDAVDDLQWDLSDAKDERTALIQALYHRLMFDRGTLFYDKTYGLGLFRYLLDTATEAQMANEIAAELGKDERVQFVAVRFTNEAIKISVTPYSAPSFPLTLSIDRVTAELLLGEGQ